MNNLNNFEIPVTNEFKNYRVDIFLYYYLNKKFSRAYIQKAIKKNWIFLSSNLDIKLKKNYLLKDFDVVVIRNIFFTYPSIRIQIDTKFYLKLKNRIIFENKDYLIINKPSNILSIPNNNNKLISIVDFLEKYFCEKQIQYFNNLYGLAHRLDFQTSGLLIAAKNINKYNEFKKIFKKHLITKIYIALTRVSTKYNVGQIITCNVPLKKDKNKWKIFPSTDYDSKSAISVFKILKRINNYFLVKIKIITGRTHQIRTHLRYIGLEILNDHKYSKLIINNYWNFGQFLHSWKLSFYDKEINKKMIFKSPLPKEFIKIINNENKKK